MNEALKELQDFLPIARRDATPIIKGYLYQIELTAQRWTELTDNEILELECGEDIDRITTDLVTGAANRTVEQVRATEATITLHSSKAIESVINFLTHRINNPSQNIFFQYTTTSKAGVEKERGAAEPGIVLWERIRIGSGSSEDLRRLRVILTTCPKPLRIKDPGAWNRFIAFRSGYDEELVEIISRFQWECSSEQPTETQEATVVLLTQRYHITSREAECIYARMVLHIMELFTNGSARRTLSKENLDNLIADTAGIAIDMALSTQIVSNLAQLSSKLDSIDEKIEQGFERLQPQLEGIYRNSNQLGLRVDRALSEGLSGSATALSEIKTSLINQSSRFDSIERYLATEDGQWGNLSRFGIIISSYLLNTTPPLKAERIHIIPSDLETVENAIANQGILWIYGGTLTGKTQLALSAFERQNQALWLNFDSAAISPEYILSNLVIGSIFPAGASMTDLSWLQGYLFVLDDVAITPGHPHEQSFLTLLSLLFKNGAKVIVTAQFDSGPRIAKTFGDHIVNMMIPAFDEHSTHEWAKERGAPESFSLGSARFVCSTASGHPFIIDSCLQYLRTNEWNLNGHTFIEIVTGTFDEKLEWATRRMVGNIGDQLDKEFLYRLSLQPSLELSTVEKISAIEPLIGGPRERISKLGAWLSVEDGKVEVSPLLRKLKGKDLNTSVKKSIHVVIAEAELEKEKIDAIGVATVVTNFLAADEINRAGHFYLYILGLLYQKSTDPEEVGFMYFWQDAKFPTSMDTTLQLGITAATIGLRHRAGKDVNALQQYLRTLLKVQTPSENYFLIFAAFYWGQLSVSESMSLIQRLEPVILNPDHELHEIINIDLLWFFSTRISLLEDLLLWCRELIRLKKHGVSNDSDVFGYQSAFMAFSAVSELEEPESDRISNLISIMSLLAEEAGEVGLDSIQSFATRSALILACEHAKDYTLGSQLYARNSQSLSGLGLAIVSERMGIYSRWEGKYLLAEELLSQAIPELVEHFVFIALVAQQQLSITYSQIHETEKALEEMKLAVENARSSSGISKISLSQSLGELALLNMNLNNTEAAFNAIEESIHLLSLPPSDDAAKDMITLLGHFVSYHGSVRTTGNPPVMADGEIFVEPKAGFFLTSNSERVKLYSDSSIAFLYVQLSWLADSIGDFEKAESWRSALFDNAELRKFAYPRASAGLKRSLELIKQFRLEEAFQEVEIDAKILIATNNHKVDIKTFLYDERVESMLGNTGSELRKKVDAYLIYYGLVPILIMCGSVWEPWQRSNLLLVVADLCESYAARATDPSEWLSATNCLKAAANRDLNWRELVLDANAQSSSLAAWFANIICSQISAAIDLNVALKGQIVLYDAYHSVIESSGPLLSSIFQDFIIAFWSNKLENERFRFDFPAMIKDLDLNGSPAIVLKAFEGLKTPPSQELLKYLLTAENLR